MDERIKLAFAAAQDSAKQVLTLTTAVLTITIAFSKDVTKGASTTDQYWLRAAWIFYALAVLAGVVTLLALTGSLGSEPNNSDDSIYSSNIFLPAAVQMAAFAIAVILTVVYGWFAFSGRDLAGAILSTPPLSP